MVALFVVIVFKNVVSARSNVSFSLALSLLFLLELNNSKLEGLTTSTKVALKGKFCYFINKM